MVYSFTTVREAEGPAKWVAEANLSQKDQEKHLEEKHQLLEEKHQLLEEKHQL
jgi:hypothetical protein